MNTHQKRQVEKFLASVTHYRACAWLVETGEEEQQIHREVDSATSLAGGLLGGAVTPSQVIDEAWVRLLKLEEAYDASLAGIVWSGLHQVAIEVAHDSKN